MTSTEGNESNVAKKPIIMIESNLAKKSIKTWQLWTKLENISNFNAVNLGDLKVFEAFFDGANDHSSLAT